MAPPHVIGRTADYNENPITRPTVVAPAQFDVGQLALGLLAVALIFVVVFWRLGAPTFWDPDEAHYAETSRGVVRSGDWWAPYYNEEPFFDKPILFHQLQGAAMVAFGPTEFAARIVPAIAALGLIGVTLWLGAA